MPSHETLNYLEFAARDLEATKKFFSAAFNWQFTDYGSDYSAFKEKNLDGGFYRADLSGRSESGGVLVVFYSENLESTLEKVEKAGGEITKATFSFPGGRRFQFTEPSGNELAVWSDREPE